MPHERDGVVLYAPDEHALVRWPSGPHAAEVRAWLGPMLEHGSKVDIANVDTSVHVLVVGDSSDREALTLPVTVTEAPRTRNAYVCSHHNHFIAYAKDELWELRSPVLESLMSAALVPAGVALDASDLDRAVFVNNWLLSTNLFPRRLTREEIERITRFLVERFPDRAIVWRSVNAHEMGPLPEDFTSTGHALVLSRQIYMVDDPARVLSTRRPIKDDRRVMRKMHYDVVRGVDLLGHEDRLVELYGLLYLDKYSRHNPTFTARLFRRWIETDTVHFQGLVRDDVIEGVMGWYARGGVMTTPVVGYDTALPQENALYRRLSMLILEAAAQHGLVVNSSAGAAGFKRLRGGEATLEFSAVYAEHLPLWRRVPWQVFSWGMSRFGIPMFQKNQL